MPSGTERLRDSTRDEILEPGAAEILPNLAESARLLANADLAFIALTDGPAQLKIVAAAGSRGSRILGLSISALRGTSAEAIRTGEPYVSRGDSPASGAARNPLLNQALQ